MLINYLQTAKYPNRTHEKGYWSNPANIQWNEAVEFSLGLKSRDRSCYSIIIDFDSLTVIKNSINGEKNFKILSEYYREHYNTQIESFLKKTSNAQH